MTTMNSNIFDLVGPANSGDYSQAITGPSPATESPAVTPFDSHLDQALDHQSPNEHPRVIARSDHKAGQSELSNNEEAREPAGAEVVDNARPKNDKRLVNKADENESKPAPHKEEGQQLVDAPEELKASEAATKPKLTARGTDRTAKTKTDTKSIELNQSQPGASKAAALLISRNSNAERIERLLNAHKTNSVTDQKDSQLSGEYSVESLKESGGEVELVARSTKSDGNRVKLIISKEQLAQMTKVDGHPKALSPAATPSTTTRVSLANPDSPRSELDQLLEKLNLTELRVEEAQPNKAESSGEASRKNELTLRFSSPDSSQSWQVKGKLAKNSKTEKKISARQNLATHRNLGNNHRAGTQVINRTANPVNSLIENPRLAETNNGQNSATPKTSNELFALGKAMPTDNLSSQSSTEIQFGQSLGQVSSKNSSNTAAQVEAAKVRFTLPDDVAQTLKADGKSIQLKIHPEILGPVRLKIRLQGEVLQARVLVDSVQVKTMVEGSLEELTQQLERAGLKVDQIEVDVAGSGAGNELFGKDVFWSKPKIKSNAAISDGTQDVLPLESQLDPVVPGQLSASSINLLA